MRDGCVTVYYGDGRGKTTAAYGTALRSANEGKTVYIIQFLKDRDLIENNIFKRLEPEIKFFRFEKSGKCYDDLTEEEKKEESINMKNGINYAKKVLVTGECSVLVLDEVLGLLDHGLIEEEELSSVIQAKPSEASIVLTGRVLKDSMKPLMNEIYHIETEK